MTYNRSLTVEELATVTEAWRRIVSVAGKHGGACQCLPCRMWWAAGPDRLLIDASDLAGADLCNALSPVMMDD